MKNIKSTLFLAFVLAITATSSLAQTGGQIPIMRAAAEPNKSTAPVITVAAAAKNTTSSEISDYLWTFVSIFSQFKF